MRDQVFFLRTPLTAASEGHVEVVRLLLEAGAEKNKKSSTDSPEDPLRGLAEGVHLRIGGWTPLHVLFKLGPMPLLRRLLPTPTCGLAFHESNPGQEMRNKKTAKPLVAPGLQVPIWTFYQTHLQFSNSSMIQNSGTLILCCMKDTISCFRHVPAPSKTENHDLFCRRPLIRGSYRSKPRGTTERRLKEAHSHAKQWSARFQPLTLPRQLLETAEGPKRQELLQAPALVMRYVSQLATSSWWGSLVKGLE